MVAWEYSTRRFKPWPFDSLVGTNNLWKGHLTIPRRSQRIAIVVTKKVSKGTTIFPMKDDGAWLRWSNNKNKRFRLGTPAFFLSVWCRLTKRQNHIFWLIVYGLQECGEDPFSLRPLFFQVAMAMGFIGGSFFFQTPILGGLFTEKWQTTVVELII